MKQVKIVILHADVDDPRVSGEVKAVEVSGLPTIASPAASGTHSDTFAASPGRHTYQFTVRPPCRITLSTVIDGVPVGPPASFDATTVNAGRRYNFEVPS